MKRKDSKWKAALQPRTEILEAKARLHRYSCYRTVLQDRRESWGKRDRRTSYMREDVVGVILAKTLGLGSAAPAELTNRSSWPRAEAKSLERVDSLEEKSLVDL